MRIKTWKKELISKYFEHFNYNQCIRKKCLKKDGEYKFWAHVNSLTSIHIKMKRNKIHFRKLYKITA